MSANIGTFVTMPLSSLEPVARDLHVTAFWGGKTYGRSVQLSVGANAYACLSHRQVRALIRMLEKAVTAHSLTDTNRKVNP